MKNILRFDKTKKFRILQLADIQFIKKMDKKSIEVMDKTIAMANPDFIVLTGDQISGEYMWLMKKRVKKILTQITEYFDKKKIPWTMCFGNHDGLWKKKSKLFMLDIYKRSEYFVGDSQSFGDIEVYCDNDKDSVSNYFIPIKDDTDKVKYGILVLDCETCLTMPYKGYLDEQTEFYKSVSKKYKDVPLVLFTHLPLERMQQAYDNRQNDSLVKDFKGEIEKPEVGRVYYATFDKEQNKKFDDAMLEYKNIKGVFVGHDHISNFAVNYNLEKDYNLIMAYGRLSTYAFGCWQYCPFKIKDMKFYKNYPKGGRVIDIYENKNIVTFDLYEDKNDDFKMKIRNEMRLFD